MEVFIYYLLLLLKVGVLIFIVKGCVYLYDTYQNNKENRRVKRIERIENQKKLNIETEKNRQIAQQEWALSKYKTEKIREIKDEALKRILWNNYYSMQNGEIHVNQLTGWEFEKFVGNLYCQMGYQVTITKKSGDFGADIIAIKDSKKTAIQCKRQISSVGVQAINEVLGGKGYYKCQYAAVVTNSTYTGQAISTAIANKVKLIDGQELTRLCSAFLTHQKPDYNNEAFNKISDLIGRFIRYPTISEIDSFINSHILAAKYVSEIENSTIILDSVSYDYNNLFKKDEKETAFKADKWNANLSGNSQLDLFTPISGHEDLKNKGREQKISVEENNKLPLINLISKHNELQNARKDRKQDIPENRETLPSLPTPVNRHDDLKNRIKDKEQDIQVGEKKLPPLPLTSISEPDNLKVEVIEKKLLVHKKNAHNSPTSLSRLDKFNINNREQKTAVVEMLEADWFMNVSLSIAMNTIVLDVMNRSERKVNISDKKMVFLNVGFMLFQSYKGRSMRKDVLESISELAENVITINQQNDKRKYLRELIYGYIEIDFFLRHENDPNGSYISYKALRENRDKIDDAIQASISNHKIDINPKFALYVKNN
ncbi:restriction endonuclease [Dyadobacter psychrophilus]|uniref:Restriction endonuclease n=1 Tax=Dyadobacter psychrophilus TaxID=651661 RepID=A0A1T5HGD1_9BACT|nr:restriction endonuclease [Dyadobacter psychrophilus]SKC19747.1 Restriction endonuclease [Dyadobacter psychrophilus]